MRRDDVQQAVDSFWAKREEQRAQLEDQGKSGGAGRANGHMGEIERIVAQEFRNAGVPAKSIKRGRPYLPGYFRIRKQWDLVVILDGILVAAIELKSQVGSVAKNINNRFEEALGTATDTHMAQAKNAPYGDVPPWLGYVFVLQETEETEKTNLETKALFPIDPEYKDMSYNERYQEMVKRFIGEQVYQAGWFLTTKVTERGIMYNEPLATATAEAFAVQIRGRVEFVKAVLNARTPSAN